MGLRFKKRIKIAPGINLNIGLGGISGSVGVPGSGLSYNKKLYDARSRAQSSKLQNEQGRKEHLSSFNLDFDKTTGALLLLDKNGNEVIGRDKTHIFKTQYNLIYEWLQEQVDDINGDVDLLGDIHFDCPNITVHPYYQINSYSIIKPSKPVEINLPPMPQLEKIPSLGFFSSLLKSKKERHTRKEKESYEHYEVEMKQWKRHCSDIDRNYKIKYEKFTQEFKEWKEEKNRHDRIEQQREEHFNTLILTDTDLMNDMLIRTLGQMSWPRETLIDFQIINEGNTVWIDVDLPEIEDLPQRVASIAATGKKINIKVKPKKQLQLEYARHIHGIALRLSCFTLATLPKVVEVIVSGYSQRMNTGTGKINDDYLYSIRFTRVGLNEINFKQLESVDPMTACEMFDNIRKMTATGIFKTIEPFSA